MDAALLAAFNAQFGIQVKHLDVLAKLLGGKQVRGWYKEYRTQRAMENALPEEMAAAGVTPAEWASTLAGRQRTNDAHRE